MRRIRKNAPARRRRALDSADGPPLRFARRTHEQLDGDATVPPALRRLDEAVAPPPSIIIRRFKDNDGDTQSTGLGYVFACLGTKPSPLLSTNSTGKVLVTYLKSGPYLHDRGVSNAPGVLDTHSTA